MSKYPSVYGVTATIVPINKRGSHVLLGKRKADAQVFPGMWCLPGGFLNPKTVDIRGENVYDAAIRELREETALHVTHFDLRLVEVYSDPDTDPRGHVINTAFYTVISDFAVAQAGDDLEEIEWVPILAALDRPLAFNHNDVLNNALTVYLSQRGT